MKTPSVIALALLAVWCRPAAAADRPNIVFILADDLGLDGVSCYGSDSHKTPHLDALAASGTRFETCYASPLCGPSRCLLLTGRYAFRTGGLLNRSWRKGGPGARSADEFPIARVLKENGYATCHSGKWRQVGETPRDWGFDEYLTDPTAGGYFWETKYTKNGQEVRLPDDTYGPDVIQDFAVDFIRRHTGRPFFCYYAMHLVHGPILRTPDTAAQTQGRLQLYDDNIRYMDKQVGSLVAEIEKLDLRRKTLIIFSGDNGTTKMASSTIGGMKINGNKSTMLEGGSRVPFIASWSGVTPAGKVVKDIISFADLHATFAELAGAKRPPEMKFDGQSFAAQLRGEPGTPRAFAFVQLGRHWFVRDPGYKMNEKGELFDMSAAPFAEKLVPLEADTDESQAARKRLSEALAELNPAGGKTDLAGENAAGPGRKKKQQK